MVIFSDIHGNFIALKKLIDSFSKDKEFIFVGDLIDRGSDGPEVVQYCIDNKYTVILGNHEDLMIDFYERTGRYEDRLWQWNGGDTTIAKYIKLGIDPLQHHVPWMKTLPRYVIRGEYIISHAPLPTNMELDQDDPKSDFQWNREKPGKIIKGQRSEMKQICGHCSMWGLKIFRYPESDDYYAMCLDTTAEGRITAYDTETEKFYQEQFKESLKKMPRIK